MKTNIKRRKGFTLVELLVVILIIAALASIATPAAFRALKRADATTATSNAKEIYKFLFLFDEEFQSFPDSTTAETVRDATDTSLPLEGDTSNDYLRQLIAYTPDLSEKIFYVKTPYTAKPDGVVTNSEALKAGECGFGYIMDQDTAQGVSGRAGRPVLVAPLLNASTDWTFDRDPFDGKAIVLRLDNSAESLIIRERDNKVGVGNGKTLEETGPESVWGDEFTPTMKAPQRRGN